MNQEDMTQPTTGALPKGSAPPEKNLDRVIRPATATLHRFVQGKEHVNDAREEQTNYSK